jgi:hypothetical protein
LGKHSDGDLAKRFNCISATIARRRELLDIPPFQRENTRYWTEAEEKLLGTDTDFKIALKLGRTKKSVIHHRHILGIPPKPVDWQAIGQRRRQMWAERKRKFGPCVVDPNDKPWTLDEDKLLGTEPDEVVARKLGRSRCAVEFRRQQMHIPLFGRKVRHWTPAEDELLGTQVDSAVAKQLQRSAIDVRWRRRALGIKPFADNGEKPWTDFELRLLGTDTDKNVARRIGRERRTIATKRKRLKIPAVREDAWTPEEVALLGTMRDEKLARKIGRNVNSVAAQRNSRGILCFNSKLHFWRPEDDKILGTRPDDQIAALLGRSTYAVATRRRDKGIPIFHSKKKRR